MGHSHSRRKDGFIQKNQYYILALIIVLGVAVSALLFKGMSLYGDDFEYVAFAPNILAGNFSESLNVFSIRLLDDYPMALMIGMLGYNNIAAGMYDLVCYALAIPVVFLLGKRLHSPEAGLISAFLFAIYPSSLKWDTTPSPMLPLVLLISLSVLLYFYGRDRDSVALYSLSGFVGFAATSANPLAFLYILMLSLAIIIEAIMVRARRQKFRAKQYYYFIGVLMGLTAFGVANIFLANGVPYYNLLFTNRYYSNAGGFDEIFYTNTNLDFYVGGYFPYGFSSVAYNAALFKFGKALEGLKGIYLGIFSIKGIIPNDVGLFPYFALVGGAVLVYKKRRAAYPALLWAVFLLAYMEFGSMSPTHYFPIYKLMRFAMIAEVPILIVLGIAIAELAKANWKKRNIGVVLAVLLLAVLFSTSMPLDYYYYIMNKNSMYYNIATASMLKNINSPGRINLYAPTLDTVYIDYYLGYSKNVNMINYGSGAYGTTYLPDCNQIANASYVVIPNAASIEEINSFNLWGINEQWAYDPAICGMRLYSNLYSSENRSSSLSSVEDLQNSGNLYYKP
jgi:hypothetical protein